MMGFPEHIMATQNRPVERRLYRQPLPLATHARAQTSTSQAEWNGNLYLRCRDCLNTWSVPKALIEGTWPAR